MQQTPTFFFNSNDGSALLGFGLHAQLRVDEGTALPELEKFLAAHPERHVFACLNYELKNEIEALESRHPDATGFPLLYLCVMENVLELKGSQYTYLEGKASEENEALVRRFLSPATSGFSNEVHWNLQPSLTREDYLEKVGSLKKHLQAGDIYEVNFCQEYAAQGVEIRQPLDFYFRLNEVTRAPYSAFVTFDEFSVFCGSPECYLSKKGDTLRSFPIKGTHRRGSTPEQDALFRETLLNDTKERAENVMIVDLVRNDLSRLATKGSVRVEELFGIYTFETVHQMISTVACTLRDNTSFSDILRATFPMGSMTGAPKIRAMQLIERHENFRRGLYSGAIGYLKPNGDFDFNVVIRSMIHNKNTGYLSCAVGSAITIHSDAEKELAECETKISRILNAFHEPVK